MNHERPTLYIYFETNVLFSSSQDVYNSGSISHLVDDILSHFEIRVDTGVTLCDLSKAFDCLCHDKLLAKLDFYVVSGTPLLFLRSYLVNREHIITIKGS